MLKNNTTVKIALLALSVAGMAVSCKKKDEDPKPGTTTFRSSFDYARLTTKTPYDSLFVDAAGAKTTDFTDGNNRLKMFTELNSHISGRVNNANNRELSLDTLKGLFSNTGAMFVDPALDAAPVNIRQATGTSKSNTSAVLSQIEEYFAGIVLSSKSVLVTAEANKAGKIAANPNPTTGVSSKYLLDTNGVELIQAIQKGLIGSFQYDYIGNVLLSDAKLSSADNSKLVTGKNYTELEHVWDEAYASFTTNRVYSITPNTSERFLGSYVREYGATAYGDDYLKIHPAFLRGRAAIVNNDLAEVKAQAAIIRGIFEKVIARAAVGYLNKWKDGHQTDPGAAFHQIGEGFGFIYSLRFCTLNGADDAFSQEILNDLVYNNPNGLWDLVGNNTKALNAISKIKTKFGI